MERKEFSIARFLSSKSRFDNIVLLEGFIVGILAGIVGVVYRLLLSYGEKMAYFVVDYIKNNILHLCIWIICVLIIGFIISKGAGRSDTSTGTPAAIPSAIVSPNPSLIDG